MEVAILGARGAVGRACIKELKRRGIHAVALDVGDSIPIDSNVLILAVPGVIARATTFQGTIIDCSGEFPDAMLSLPGILETTARQKRTPNCMASLIAQAVSPLHEKCTIRRIITTTMQCASGAGWHGVQALEDDDTFELFKGQLAHNVLPHENAEEEEQAIAEDLHAMFGCIVTATTFRVPVRIGHIASVHVETEQPIDASCLPESDVFDPRSMEGKRNVAIGRVRINKNTADFVICGDQLICGTAIPAVNSIFTAEFGED